MRWKTTLILLLVTVGVGAYVSLYEIKQPSPEEREHLSRQILDIQADTISQLVLDMPEAKVTLSRDGSAWKISPGSLRADSELIERITRELSPLTSQRILLGSPQVPLDPKNFGLDPAVGWITFVANASPTTLFIGEKTPVQENRYLKVSNRPEIFIVSSSLFAAANTKLESFRDPILIHLNSWEARELTVKSQTSAFSLASSDGNWNIMKPFSDRADRVEVTSLLNNLSQMRIKHFVDDAPNVEQLASWGFDNPKAELALMLSGEQPNAITLFFGKPLPDDSSAVFAKRSDESALYAVAASDVESLLKDVKTLRAKSCFEFFTSSVNKAELKHQGSGWAIEQSDGKWKESSSQTALDAERVTEFLGKLSDLRLLEFVDDAAPDLTRYGLGSAGPTEGSISVWITGGNQPQRLLIGSAVENTQERYGLIEGRPSVVKLPPLINEILSTTLDSLKAPTETPSPSAPSNN